MISNPKQGQKVFLWYAEKKRPWAPYHGKRAVVVLPGNGKPKNHLVKICDILPSRGDRLVAAPSGNLITPEKRLEFAKKKINKDLERQIIFYNKSMQNITQPRYDDIYFKGVEYLDTL